MNKINGVDVSEEIRYCNSCSNLGLDFTARKFYCSLSHRPDELPEALSCDEFSTNCYIKRLQEENKRLQMLSCANCGEKYLSPDGAELYEKNVQLYEKNVQLYEKNVQLQEENEKLKANKGRCAFKSLDNTFCDEAKFKIDKLELDKNCLNASLETARKYRGVAEVDRDKYKQALEEIREIVIYMADDLDDYETCYNAKEKLFAILNEVLK